MLRVEDALLVTEPVPVAVGPGLVGEAEEGVIGVLVGLGVEDGVLVLLGEMDGVRDGVGSAVRVDVAVTEALHQANMH